MSRSRATSSIDPVAHDLALGRKRLELAHRFAKARIGDLREPPSHFAAEAIPVGLRSFVSPGPEKTLSLECALEHGELPEEVQNEVAI